MRASKYVGRNPGCRLRGHGSWLGPRAGSLYKRWDPEIYYRGAGFMDWLKNAAAMALRAIKRYIIPHIVKSGPDMAKLLTKYATNKAADYIDSSQRFGPAKGLIRQALNDLPSVVGDIVQSQINQRFEPLDKSALDSLKQQRASGPDNRQLMALYSMLDARPVIEQAMEPLMRKYNSIERYSHLLNDGRTRDAYEVLSRMGPMDSCRPEFKQLQSIIDLIESMITSNISHAEDTGMIPPSSALNQFLSGAVRVCENCCSVSDLRNVVESRRNISALKKKPIFDAMHTISPGMGEFDLASNRGGFVGMASLGAMLIPALIGMLPGMVSSVSDAVATHTRGKGLDIESIIPRSELQKILEKALSDGFVKSNFKPPTKKHNLAVAVNSAKRQRRL